MSKTSRRSFLVGAGAGAVTSIVVSPALGAVAAPASTRKGGGSTPVVAHVGDPTSGTLVLYAGTEAFVVQDPDLVQRLTRAARRR
jgi:hypothetical protein